MDINETELAALLGALSNAKAPSGFEDETLAVVRSFCEGWATVEENTYDENGRLIRTDQYTQDGQPMGAQVFGWDEETGYSTFVENYSAGGTLENRLDYTRDTQGRTVRTEVTGPDGELISFVITEYRGDVSFSTGYDADGNVLYSVEQ